MLAWKSLVSVFVICILIIGPSKCEGGEEPNENEETEDQSEALQEFQPSSYVATVSPSEFVQVQSSFLAKSSSYGSLSLVVQQTSVSQDEGSSSVSISDIKESITPTQTGNVSPTQGLHSAIQTSIENSVEASTSNYVDSSIVNLASTPALASSSVDNEMSVSSLLASPSQSIGMIASISALENSSSITSSVSQASSNLDIETPNLSKMQSITSSTMSIEQSESIFSTSIDHQQESSSVFVSSSVSTLLEPPMSSVSSSYQQLESFSSMVDSYSTALPGESEIISSSSSILPEASEMFSSSSPEMFSSPSSSLPEQTESFSSSPASSQMHQSSSLMSKTFESFSMSDNLQSFTSIMESSSASMSPSENIFESFSTSILDSQSSISLIESLFESVSPLTQSIFQSSSSFAVGQESSVSSSLSYSSFLTSSPEISTESLFETQPISTLAASSDSLFETQPISTLAASSESLFETQSISTLAASSDSLFETQSISSSLISSIKSLFETQFVSTIYLSSSSEMEASYSSSMSTQVFVSSSISSSIDESVAVSTSLTPSSAMSSEVVSSSIFILPQVPSASPENLTAIVRSSTQIDLSWDEPPFESQNGQIISYNIQVIRDNQTEKSLNTTEQFYDVTNLRKFTNYTFLVSASNEIGEGPSAMATKQTLPDLPDTAPTNLTAQALSSTNIQIHWIAPPIKSINGIFEMYTIRVRLQSESSIEQFLNTTDTFYNVTNLSIFKEYTFEVRLKNEIGEGPEIEATFKTLPDIPSIVRNFTCFETLQNSITLTWAKPDNPNGIIENYRISRTDSEESEVEELDGKTSEKTFTMLHPYRLYNFTIQARTSAGYGTIAEVTCMTKESKPDVPDNLRTGVVSSYWFTLLWNAPLKVHGIINSYHLEIRSERRNEPFREELNGEKIQTNMMFNMSFGVTPYTRYACYVTAQTSIGKGQPANVNLTTQQAAPSPVRALTASDIGATSIRLSWVKPEYENGIVLYRVFQIETDSDDQVSIGDGLVQTGFFVEKGIQPYTEYNFSVQAYTLGGGDSELETITVRSDSAIPGVPTILELSALSNSSISVTWRFLTESEGNGIVNQYTIRVHQNEIKILDKPYEVEEGVTRTNATVVITGLSPWTEYRFSIAARNDKGMGEFSQYREIKTLPGTPGKPQSLKVSNISNVEDDLKKVRIEWKAPLQPNGEIKSYKIFIYQKGFDTPFKVFTDEKSTSKEVGGLEPFTRFVVEVQAFNSIFGPKARLNFITISAAPSGPPKSFTAVEKDFTPNSIKLQWKPPTKPNGIITNYFISYDKGKDSIITYVDGNKQTTNIEDLKPFTSYTFAIKCKSTGGEGPLSDGVTARTLATDPVIPSVTPKPILGSSETTITIQMWTPNDENGRINFYYIVVLDSAEKPRKLPNEYTDEELRDQTYQLYLEAKNADKTEFKPYITASLSRDEFSKLKNGTFVIGQSQQQSRFLFNVPKYDNGPLSEGRSYHYFIRAHISQDLYVSSPDWRSTKTTGGETKGSGTGDEGSNLAGPIAGTFVAIIVVLVLAIGFVYYRRRQQMGGTTVSKKMDELDGGAENKGYIDDPVHLPAAHPVKVENYQAYVRNLAKDGKYLFSEEFKMILRGRSGYNCLYEHSNHPINRDKNRYNNIAAYDHTRVLLEPLEGIPESDYINANYIDGYMEQAAYIACQGPLEGTCEDMWRMCWEKNVSTIVMLTQCVENGRDKCYHYWPEVGTKCYGSMEVTLTESTFLPVYSMRTFSLLNDQYPGSEKFVRHFAFCAWPDHGTPNAQQLLTFIRRVNQCHQQNSGPIIVHCSAGVGRTGTYIVMDVNLKRIKTEQNIEIYNYLQHIRSQRNHMVQTESQYVFIHDALLEYLTFGTTEINVRDLRDYVKKLQQTVDSGMETHLDKEFQKLNHFDQSGMKSMNAANSSYNKAKNRFLNVLPYDDTRVSLTHLPGIPGSDYINANYVNGYNMSKLFIATQAPLPQTIPAFWRLVWEHQCMTIVCLAQETENGKVKIHRYWPSIEAAMHGTLMIENIDEQVHNEYIVRDFKVTHTTDGLSRKIRHFQYTAWPDNAYPESGSGFVDMIGQVQKWHQQNEIGQIVVHCSAGVGRTGVFIGLCNLIERVKIEGYVDVFQVVREMRTQRPAMVQTKVQYLFCYLALQDFLASFDIYQNFM
ncbi:receptor-type tyrosine-protein phosphatase S-like isoform X2 [Clytia hemisphaerica]|uniref:protein-tyrosine-phosphatase n=1 Tax=Clytia hemisphaerica TaxID=252671 RepID=A0A7M5XGF3_9CNID